MSEKWKWHKAICHLYGYWELEDMNGGEVLCLATDCCGEDCSPPYMIISNEHARLIAAAPETKEQRDELLGACKCLLLSADSAWDGNNLGHDWREACDMARAAIAKATGGS